MTAFFSQKYGPSRVVISDSLTPNKLVATVETKDAKWQFIGDIRFLRPMGLQMRISQALLAIDFERPATEELEKFVKDFYKWRNSEDEKDVWPTNILPFVRNNATTVETKK